MFLSILLQKTAAPSKKAKAVPETPGASTGVNANTLSSPSATAPAGVAPVTAEKKTFNVNTIRFKFNQGFSNAVKRSVLMEEFL